MELIYKDALLKELGITNDDCEKCAWGDGYGDCKRGSDFTDVCDAIYIAPTIEERKTGKWQITDAYPHNIYCSECHRKFAQTHWAVWEDGSLPRNFCPNCGADMREQP